ncbi:LamG-like jellyroll fold domain-containing protein [Nostoc sp.]|uniref:LamG-like jellyroll fold domain-containing protein n=1 Tax=Nostoc sp. TaxID=1180 RepID=UPI002FF58142
MPVNNPIIAIPAEVRNQVADSDYVLMIDSDGMLYQVSKVDFFLSNLPIYINLPLIETTGTIARDISGNDLNATYINVLNNSDGKVFDGTGRISLNDSINALSILSIEIEFKSSSNSNQGLWEFRASQDLSSGTYTPSLIMSPNGQLSVYGYPSGSGYASRKHLDGTFDAYNDGNWHKSIVVMSNNNIKIFVDKVKILDVNANPITPFSGFFSIGSTRANGNWIGQLKNFKVRNIALTDVQAISLS